MSTIINCCATLHLQLIMTVDRGHNDNDSSTAVTLFDGISNSSIHNIWGKHKKTLRNSEYMIYRPQTKFCQKMTKKAIILIG